MARSLGSGVRAAAPASTLSTTANTCLSGDKRERRVRSTWNFSGAGTEKVEPEQDARRACPLKRLVPS